MRFHLSDEQQELYDTVLRAVSGFGGGGAARRAVDGNEPIDAELWEALCELGVSALAAPEEFGGLDLELLDLSVIAEALGREGAPVPFLHHTLAVLALKWAGTPEQRSEWLPKLASGEVLGSVALEEAGGVVDPEAFVVSLSSGALDGRKINVACPTIAGLTVVGCMRGQLALVAGPIEESRCFAIDVADRTRRLWNVDVSGLAAQSMAAQRGIATRLCDAARILLAADAAGGAYRIFDMTVDYVKVREQFGGPIGRFQAVKHQLANLLIQVEPLRPLVWYAGYAFDRREHDAGRTAAVAKAHATDVFMTTAREAVQLHGGMGYTWEYDAQIWLKRAMFDFALMGTPTRLRRRAADLARW